jgi:hypothetical protein
MGRLQTTLHATTNEVLTVLHDRALAAHIGSRF